MGLPPPIVGRDAQLAALAAVVGLPTDVDTDGTAPREPAPPLVVVYGGVSAGKSRCVLHALRSAADHFALVDGTGVMTTRAFYKEVLGQLQSNARGGRRPRRDVEPARDDEDEREKNAEGEEEDEEEPEAVTITDAPPEARGSATAKRRKGPRRARRRRRRVDEERKGSEDEEGSSDEEDADDDGSDDSDNGRTVARSAKPSVNVNAAASQEFDVALRDGGAADPAHASLNVLSFVKALRGHMDTMAAPQRARGAKPTVFIALDHVETLLERGFEKLITCLLAVNDQLDYLHVFDEHGAPWRLCVVLIARAVSLNLDLFLNGAHPAFIHFPAYTKEEVAAIVAQNLLRAADPAVALDDNRERAAWLRKWLVVVYDLLPHCHADWLEFQHVVAQMLPSFHAFFDLVSRDEHAPLPQLAVADDAVSSAAVGGGTNRSWVQLQNASRDRVATLEKTRRRHLFGYDNVGGVAASTAVSSGDPVAFIASSKLSRSCQLLLLASYLASFTPHEADAHFVSSAGGLRRKRRIHRESGAPGAGANGAPGGDSNSKGGAAGRKAASARKAMDQQLVGPKIFELPRLMAIYLSLQIENDALVDEVSDRGRQDSDRSTRTRADIFTHLSLLVRLRLLQRASPPSDLDRPLFRCIADTRLVHEIARRLQFPLDAYLTTRG